MTTRYAQCPLGGKCPGSGRHIPGSSTFKLHQDMAQGKSLSVDSSSQSAVSDFSSSQESSPHSDAVISPDGTSVSFNHIKDPKERSRALQEELLEGMGSLAIDEDKYNEYIDFIKSGYNYSLRNQLLLALQKPSGGDFKTYKQWKALGYQVRAGSQSAYVLRPIIKEFDKVDDNGNPIMGEDGKPLKERGLVGYTSYGVFSDEDLDESVKKLPVNPIAQHYYSYMHDDSIENVDALRDDITRVAHSLNTEIKFVDKDDDESLSNGASGYARRNDTGDGYVIVVSNDSAQHAQTATMAHEIGHIMCGHLDDEEKRNYKELEHRGQMEVEAESIAYALGRDYGLDMGNRSFSYLKSWAQDDTQKISKAMGTVSKALGSYYSSLEKIISGSNKNDINAQANDITKTQNAQRKKSRKKRR